MRLETAIVAGHAPEGRAYRRLDFAAPHIAARVQPGQFVHLRVPALEGSALRRPFSVFDADGPRLSILYKVVGRGTAAMQALRNGDPVDLMGPLGNGFPDPAPGTRPVLVAGGYGAAPLHFLARRLARPGIAFIGGARCDDLLGLEAFAAAGWPVRAATEDGSLGSPGFVTAPLDTWLRNELGADVPEFFACGPHAMLRAVGERAVARGWNAWLSMDRRMGCGVGACLACVQRLRRDGRPVWGRVCTDGPVFESREVAWDDALNPEAP